jgi:hypothetical protein
MNRTYFSTKLTLRSVRLVHAFRASNDLFVNCLHEVMSSWVRSVNFEMPSIKPSSVMAVSRIIKDYNIINTMLSIIRYKIARWISDRVNPDVTTFNFVQYFPIKIIASSPFTPVIVKSSAVKLVSLDPSCSKHLLLNPLHVRKSSCSKLSFCKCFAKVVNPIMTLIIMCIFMFKTYFLRSNSKIPSRTMILALLNSCQ